MQSASELRELVFGEFAHGANTRAVSTLYDLSKEDLLDMSSSTNPLITNWIKRHSRLVKEVLSKIYEYPDPEGADFKSAVSQRFGIPEKSVLPSNGSVELVYFCLVGLKPRSVLIVEPTFVEYAKACKTLKVPVQRVFLLNYADLRSVLEDILKKQKVDLVFLCNPNNPTGAYARKNEILSVIKESDEVFFVVDEAFIEFREEESLIKESAELKNLLVLRSLTKFYGLAGLRIGFGVGDVELIKKIKKVMPPWRVNALAEKIAERLILDEEFYRKTKEYFSKEKKSFERGLKKLGVKFFPSVTSFYLIHFEGKGKRLWEDFLKRGILLRSCFNFFGLGWDYIRVSLKKSRNNKRFLKELEECLRVA